MLSSESISLPVQYSIRPGSPKSLERRFLVEAQGVVEKWLDSFPSENNGVYQKFRVPSLVVRVDCAPNGALNVIGVKGSHLGVGLMSHYHNLMRSNLRKIRGEWPKVSYIESPSRRGKHDCGWWLPAVSKEQLKDKAELVFINADETELGEYGYMNFSASPLFKRGDRSYGEGWLWEKVDSSDFYFLPWQESAFCLKSPIGSDMKGVYVYYPHRSQLQRRHLHDAATRSQIFRALKQSGFMYKQRFIESVFKLGALPTIFSLFFLYSPSSHSFIYCGGLSISRPNLKVASIYGATLGLVN